MFVMEGKIAVGEVIKHYYIHKQSKVKQNFECFIVKVFLHSVS